MSTVNKVIITTIIIIVVALGAWWVIASMSSDSNNSSSNEATSGKDDEADETEAAAETITYDGASFMPTSITVKAGDTIEVVNNSDNVMYFASDEHPTHLDNSELNVGDVQPGSSATLTLTSPGTWGYHDHYNAAASGEIIVEE
jgi:plastocyanin